MQYAYGCVVPSGQSAEKQEAAFIKAGLDRIFIDTPKDTDNIDTLLGDHVLAAREGDEIWLVCEAYLGYPGRKRRSILNKICERGILIGIVGEDAILYDTKEKQDDFIERAKSTAMKDRGSKATEAMGAGPGKPSKAGLTIDEWRILRFFWANTGGHRAHFVDCIREASERNGRPVLRISDDNLLSWLGRRDPKTPHDPPPNLIVDAAKPTGK